METYVIDIFEGEGLRWACEQGIIPISYEEMVALEGEDDYPTEVEVEYDIVMACSRDPYDRGDLWPENFTYNGKKVDDPEHAIAEIVEYLNGDYCDPY